MWKEWFESRFGTVFMVTVCLNNGPLLRLFKSKRYYEHELYLDTAHNYEHKGLFTDSSLDDVTNIPSPRSWMKKFLEVIGMIYSKLSVLFSYLILLLHCGDTFSGLSFSLAMLKAHIRKLNSAIAKIKDKEYKVRVNIPLCTVSVTKSAGCQLFFCTGVQSYNYI